MSNFVACPRCQSNVLRGADECPQCGYAMRAADRRAQAGIDKNEHARRRAELKFTTDYEQERYGLEPQGITEDLDVYVARINDQKTPLVMAELQGMEANLLRYGTHKKLITPPREREPGEDG